ncbi:MAG: OpgC domain-containing protein [Hyphomicrobiales bacterium]|nr:OpgC domain-containing protein [Hyphomicrobiales bacterium]
MTQQIAKRQRDPRLDFFRGLGMFIILIAHIPWNSWTDWIPARFGFSDAADLFVFCSGMASAIAFAPVFDHLGWLRGAARILYRVWQVYWAHIGSFFVVLALVCTVDAVLGGGRYAADLRIDPVLDDFRAYVGPIMTLRYVPNYFDILPMYLAILAMTPIVMALERIGKWAAIAAVLGCWLAAQFNLVSLTADSVSGRQWFFNPFGWELVFFSGFAFARGWLPAPPRDARLAIAALALVLLAAPVSCQTEFSCFALWGRAPVLGDVHIWLGPAIDKTAIGALRYLHFMATAYLAFLAVGPQGRNLHGWLAERIRRVGQQTLAVFLTGLVAAQALGMVLDRIGRGFVNDAAVNIAGCAILVAAAAIVTWFKSPPWRSLPKRSPASIAPKQDAMREPLAPPSIPRPETATGAGPG